jgi:thiol-disulfide isomerase/thioredoxin
MAIDWSRIILFLCGLVLGIFQSCEQELEIEVENRVKIRFSEKTNNANLYAWENGLLEISPVDSQDLTKTYELPYYGTFYLVKDRQDKYVSIDSHQVFIESFNYAINDPLIYREAQSFYEVFSYKNKDSIWTLVGESPNYSTLLEKYYDGKISYLSDSSFVNDALVQSIRNDRSVFENALLLKKLPLINQFGDTIFLNLNNKPYHLDLWASWCRPCRQLNKKFSSIYEAKGVEPFANLIQINTDQDYQDFLRSVEKDGIFWPVFWASPNVLAELQNSLKFHGLPYGFALNAGRDSLFWHQKGLERIGIYVD